MDIVKKALTARAAAVFQALEHNIEPIKCPSGHVMPLAGPWIH